MSDSRTRRRVLMALLAVFALVLAACGGDDDDTSEGADGGDLSGEIVVSGSSTVEPISSLVGELFSGENPDVAVRVDGPGTGDGFQLFCAGETDISNASRAIKDEEIALCEENGIEYVELQVAIDGLTVITNPANDAVTCLSFEQLYGLVGPESEGFDNWSAANELVTEIGGEGDLPDAPLDITAPGEESGTYDSFIELALVPIAEARLEAGAITEDQVETTRPDYSSQANDNAIIEGISGSDTSLGWVGFAFADLNSDSVKSLEVDGGDGCIAPNAETIADGTYPISRPLFIYVNTAKATENAAVAAYVDFYLSDVGYGAVAEADYVQLDDAAWQETVSTWDAAGIS
ncbi:MAG: phosphate ABC transporter substrate-binding protein PstS family protein [Actinomycetota bacterium]|nr:phosphate ABC transporter substrate-binding protein PstS family protein [Actinomycetota bacterium]